MASRVQHQAGYLSKDGNMKKSTKIFQILKRIVNEPGIIRELFDEELYYKKKVIDQHQMKQGLPQINLLDLFPDFNETVEPYSFLDGTSLPVDIALLKGCARAYRDCRYLEIGTWRGESVANVAPLTGSSVTINLPDNAMRQMALPENYIASHEFFSKQIKNVKHIRHDSTTFDFKTLKEKSDLIFVDGDHHYENVVKDTMSAFNQIESEKSTIVWHDYGLNPEAIRWTVFAGIMDGCPADKRKFLYHVSNTLCAIYTTKPFNTTVFTPFQKPDKFFTVKITGHKI
jgi:hypothetical protein